MKWACAAVAILIVSGGCARRTVSLGRPGVDAPAVRGVMRQQVINAAEAGEGDPIVYRLRQRIAAEAENADPRVELAAHFGRHGQPELELEHLRVATERFPASRPAHMGLAQALRTAGEPRQAADALERYLRHNPAATADPELWNRLGICYDEAGDWPAGEQAFRAGLSVGPDLDYLHNNLGYNLLEQNRVTEAVAVLQAAVKHHPRSETARNNLGVALVRSSTGSAAQALQHFENVADAATAHNNLAAALIEQQRYQESRKLLEAALDYNRSHAVALANLQLLSELDGRPAELPVRKGRVTPWRWPVVIMKRIFAPAPAPAARPVEAAKGDGR